MASTLGPWLCGMRTELALYRPAADADGLELPMSLVYFQIYKAKRAGPIQLGSEFSANEAVSKKANPKK